MKQTFIAGLISLTTVFSSANAIEACDTHFKTLYKEIQIFNQTEKISEGDGLVGYQLQAELKSMKSQRLSLKEKIQGLETGFAHCEMPLTDQDESEIKMATEELLKAKNPLITD